MSIKPKLLMLVSLYLSGCAGLFGHGCVDDGGIASWHQQGIHDALANAAAAQDNTTLTTSPAGPGIPIEQGAVAAWNASLASVRLDEANQTWIVLDLSVEPPQVRAFVSPDDARVFTHRFLQDLVVDEAALQAWLQDFSEPRTDQNPRGQDYRLEVLDLELQLTAAFAAVVDKTRMEAKAADAMDWVEAEGRRWHFSIPSQEAWQPDQGPVRTNVADFVFVKIPETPQNDAEAQEMAGAQLAAYQVDPSIGDRFTFEAMQICT